MVRPHAEIRLPEELVTWPSIGDRFVAFAKHTAQANDIPCKEKMQGSILEAFGRE